MDGWEEDVGRGKKRLTLPSKLFWSARIELVTPTLHIYVLCVLSQEFKVHILRS